MSIPRRSVLWTVPAVTVVAAAPSFATSALPPVPDLDPGGCRRPGEGKHDKDYFVRTRHRDAVVVTSVIIDGEVATVSDHGWTVSRTDSRIRVPVVILYTLEGQTATQQWEGELRFDICEDRK